jgi:hypothetical protein
MDAAIGAASNNQEITMKIRQIQTETNQHVVAIEKDGDLRCYFVNSSIQTAGATIDSLRRDIANHGESVIEFSALPLIASRTSKSGKTLYRGIA